MGNRWGKGKRKWGAEEGGGGKVSIQPTRDLSGRESRQRRDFQVSKEGSRDRGGIPKQEGGLQKDWGVLLQYHANIVHIVPIGYMLC